MQNHHRSEKEEGEMVISQQPQRIHMASQLLVSYLGPYNSAFSPFGSGCGQLFVIGMGIHIHNSFLQQLRGTFNSYNNHIICHVSEYWKWHCAVHLMENLQFPEYNTSDQCHLNFDYQLTVIEMVLSSLMAGNPHVGFQGKYILLLNPSNF